jgi:hypothetical protein
MIKNRYYFEKIIIFQLILLQKILNQLLKIYICIYFFKIKKSI